HNIILARGETFQQIKADQDLICVAPKSFEEVSSVIDIVRAIHRDKRVMGQDLKKAVRYLNKDETVVQLTPLEISVDPEWSYSVLEEVHDKVTGLTPEKNAFRKALLDAIDLAREYRQYHLMTPESMGIDPTESFMHAYEYRIARKFWANPYGKSAERVTEVGDYVTAMIADHLGGSSAAPVFSGKSSKSLAANFSEAVPPSQGMPLSNVFDDVRTKILDHQMRLANPKYFGHMLTYAPTAAIFGDALASATNPNQIAYEVGPASTMVEVQLTNWLCHLMGFRSYTGEKGKIVVPGGTLTAGGTLANLTAMLVARNKALHEFFVSIDTIFRRHKKYNKVDLDLESTDITKLGIWGAMRLYRKALETEAGKALLKTNKGQQLKKYLDTDFVILTSDEAHYSHKKLGGYIGIGGDNVIGVEVNDKLQMSPEALLEKIKWCKENNKTIIAIIATAGTTETGNIDPLKEIANIAQLEKIWFHIDAAFGGALTISHKYKERVAGIELADSITFDPHKWMFMPYALGAALFRDAGMLESYLKQSAPYVMHAGSIDPNLGSVSVHGSMRFSGLKLWITLKAMGTSLLGRVIDQNIDMTTYLKGKLDDSKDFEVLSYPEMDLICFRYVPRELKYYLDQAVKNGDALKIVKVNRILNKLNNKLQAEFQKHGEGWLSKTNMQHSPYSTFKSGISTKDAKHLDVVALRAVIMNPYTTAKVIDEVMNFLEYVGSAEFEKIKTGILKDLADVKKPSKKEPATEVAGPFLLPVSHSNMGK
ncbi:MAG: pyridoxal-dependent decarboxylase, partial [Candidatus Margulisiibacteriota bacterium]